MQYYSVQYIYIVECKYRYMDRKMFCGGHELYSSNIIGGRRFDDQSTSLDEQRSTEQCISSKLSVYFYPPTNVTYQLWSWKIFLVVWTLWFGNHNFTIHVFLYLQMLHTKVWPILVRHSDLENVVNSKWQTAVMDNCSVTHVSKGH